MKLEDTLALMKGMADHRIGVLEMPGLKLVAAAPDRAVASPVNSIRIPDGPPPGPMPTTADAEKAVQAARIEAARQAAEARQALNLGALQTRTALARRKAASTTAPPSTGQAIEDLYKESLKTARRAPKPTTT